MLAVFHPAVQEWFASSFPAPTMAQQKGWAAIAGGHSTLILAPTGSGKTLAAFLWCINRLMFEPVPEKMQRCRVLYVSPLKALAVDVERNLRAPIIGISNAAQRLGSSFVVPAVGIRSGDTPAQERARFARNPSDILITTPESLYLLLTSNARETLRSVDTVIVDEIHALVPGKRGVHLALSLERLGALSERPLQRIGLSATQNPLEEVAHFLGGVESTSKEKPKASRSKTANGASEIDSEFEDQQQTLTFRKVEIVDAGEIKRLRLKIEVPVEDMAKMGIPSQSLSSGPAAQSPKRTSIWTAIHPRLLKLIQSHQSTLIFVNSRRIAERLSGALNDLAGENLVRAHHGSVALAKRQEIEDSLKAGTIKGLVATSSLELGIDMGAIDLVIQIEAAPSVASGMQRIGRAGHQVGAVSEGIIFPKYRGDLMACATMTRAMHQGKVEAVRYPRNALDILAQHMVAMVALDNWKVDDLFALVRRAAPYAKLQRSMFENVMEMLAGRYPSDEFAELRPRITWDRATDILSSRSGARSVAVINGGTIPDRGLFAVYLAGSEKGKGRIGELDEEMVFECRPGDTFVLGASTWRIEQITHDRVVVSPAPGEPGKMPFWHGDAAGRPVEFGMEIGKLVRELQDMSQPAATLALIENHDLDQQAAANLLRYLADQAVATGQVPSDQNIVIERCRDELGDWRICVLTPLGSRIHAPWCMAVAATIESRLHLRTESMWTDDGFVIRLPESLEPPDSELFLPQPEEVEAQVIRQLGSTSLFAAKFREVAARALLLPKRRPGGRAPLWQQRKKAADLLAAASKYGSFPMLLETYRECLREIFDISSLREVLRKVRERTIRVTTVDSERPSPFASALLFSYIANYIYEGDAPLAERRAQALSIDQNQLRELLGDVDLRELLDIDVLDQVEARLQSLDEDYRVKNADGLHDLLLRIGDLREDEIVLRSVDGNLEPLQELIRTRRAIPIRILSETRYVAVEDMVRFRDTLGVPTPPGIPKALLTAVANPIGDLVRRYARTHGPFTTMNFAARFGFPAAIVEAELKQLQASGRLIDGEFRPGGAHHEWCDSEVLRLIRSNSLSKLRKEIEPVDQVVLARFVTRWQGVVRPRRGLDAVLDAVEVLQGAPLPASVFESEILRARVSDYSPGELDTLMAAGEIVWCGVEPLGEHNGRINLFLADHLTKLWKPPLEQQTAEGLPAREQRILDMLKAEGALFFDTLHQAVGGGYPGDTLSALWNMVWRGLITNDTFHVVRSYTRPAAKSRSRDSHVPGSPGLSPRQFHSRRTVHPSGQGRWYLLSSRIGATASISESSLAQVQNLLHRYGVLTREALLAENISGGFSGIYPALKALEDSGRIRRGLFVASVGATQFAVPAALDLLRSSRIEPDPPEAVYLASTDPANPYGTSLRWPSSPVCAEESEEERGDANATDRAKPRDEGGTRLFARAVGSSVILVNGRMAAYLKRNNPELLVFLPEEEPERSQVARALAMKLGELALQFQSRRSGLLISRINSASALSHPISGFLVEANFVSTPLGFQMKRVAAPSPQ